MHTSDFISLVDHCIDEALYNPVIIEATKNKRGFDLIAYQDALLFLSEALDENSLTSHQMVIDNNKAFIHRLHLPSDYSVTNELLVANHEILLFSLPVAGEKFKLMNRILGMHNALNTNEYLFKGKNLHFIIPFEMITLVHSGHVFDLVPSECFKKQPLSKVFHTSLTPAAVAGVCINGNIQNTQGYVVHTDALLQEIIRSTNPASISSEDMEDKRASLQYDTGLALKMLKSRYSLPIDDEYIARIVNFDKALHESGERHGAIVVEY